MFDRVTIHGGQASLLWGYRPVAVLTSYRITKADDGEWRLSATLTRADSWQCRQAAKYQELLFSAPVKAAGVWQLIDVNVGTNELRATLGPPLQ